MKYNLKSNNVSIKCECGTHILMIENMVVEYPETDKKSDQSFNISFFEYGQYTPKPSFFTRIKTALKFIKDGTFYKDQVTLNPTEAVKLRNFIDENLIK